MFQTNMSLESLLLNINNVDSSSLVCQTAIQTEEDKKYYSEKGYLICLTEHELKEKFNLDSSCVWYTPSISYSSLYFNKDTLAVSPLHIELYAHGLLYDVDNLYKAIHERELEVENNTFSGSVNSLPDGMRMDYFKLLIEKKGSDLPGLYELFFSTYLQSDYGFKNIDVSTLEAIIGSKIAEDIEKTKEKLKDFPDVLKIYRGGNTASTPADEAYSWSLDINVANFFASRLGIGEGYIVEAEVAKQDIIDVFLDDLDEQEVVVRPSDVKILSKIPVRGVDFIKPILPEISPIYHKYMDQMKNLTFAQDSSEHGLDHQARVLLLSLTISHLLDLPMHDKKILATAAIFHDTHRTNDDVDPTHGQASKEYYDSCVDSPDPLVQFLCKYHCLPDHVAYEEIMNNRKLSKHRNKAKLLFDVFKDADALDRVRFGLRDLDLNQLRLPVSKELSLVSRLFLREVKVSSKPRTHKSSLASKIQSASTRTRAIKSDAGRSVKSNISVPER